MARRLAVVGGGWAGLAAAVEATRLGDRVTLFEMAASPGGRARAVEARGLALDNGQHILIGAYVETLALLRRVGVDPDGALLRTPLTLAWPDGTGLRLRPGPAGPAFAAAVLRQRAWSWPDRLALLAAAGGWALRRFRCDAGLTVAELTARLPPRIRDELIDPLCVAALNTPSSEAAAGVFLRVLQDALFAAPGSADLLLPRVDLGRLLPEPAVRWLREAGTEVRLQRRVDAVVRAGAGWRVDGEAYDAVVLATSPVEAARLAAPTAAAWAQTAAALRYEPIVTVYARAAGLRLPFPMLALRATPEAPAQFVLDRGALGGPDGLLAFVISGAQAWVERGKDATEAATLSQGREALGVALEPVHTLTEKRATFRCTPGLRRPPMQIAPGLHAAGDHVDGPYPATLEGAVRSGLAAVRGIDALPQAGPTA